MSQKNEKLKHSLGRFLTVLCDIMLLNVLWLICSLPVLTIGPATCALFAVTGKMVRDEDNGIVKSFFKAFKENFTNSFIFGLIIAAGLVIVYSDIVFALSQDGQIRIVFLIVSGIVSAVILNCVSYLFALQARYENTIKGHVKNAFLIAFCFPTKTVAIWIILLAPLGMLFLLPQVVVAYLGSFFLLVGIAAPIYYVSGIQRKMFDRFSDTGIREDTSETDKEK